MSAIKIRLDSYGRGYVNIDGLPVRCTRLSLKVCALKRPVLVLIIRAKDGVEIEADDVQVITRDVT